MNKIIKGDFSKVKQETIKEALIEYYSKRAPSWTFVVPNLNVEIDINIEHTNHIQHQEPKKETKDVGVQADENKDKYLFIYKIQDKRNRRSAAWKIYKDLCVVHNTEPEIKYPDGDFKDYLNLAKKLEHI